MELFLNICWLALLLPAFLLWLQRASRSRSTRASLAIVCSLGCVLVLLFPVISASDDLHAVGQAMEESKRTFHHGGHGGHALTSVAHSSLFTLPVFSSPKAALEQVGATTWFSPHSLATFVTLHHTGRAPPATRLISL